jgi:hypothetical protein
MLCRANGFETLAFGDADRSGRVSTPGRIVCSIFQHGNVPCGPIDGGATTAGSIQALEILFHLCLNSYDTRGI